jgi:hypothetical protein
MDLRIAAMPSHVTTTATMVTSAAVSATMCMIMTALPRIGRRQARFRTQHVTISCEETK